MLSRTFIARAVSIVFCGPVFVFGCSDQSRRPTVTDGATASTAVKSPLPRGVAELQLGVSVTSLSGMFALTEEEGLAATLESIGKTLDAAKWREHDTAFGIKYLKVLPALRALPSGSVSAHLTSTNGIVYKVGVLYDEASLRAKPWSAMVGEHVERFGTPTKRDGNTLVWEDGSTRVELSGPRVLTNAQKEFEEKFRARHGGANLGPSVSLWLTDMATELRVERPAGS